jgi:hypothetical protein
MNELSLAAQAVLDAYMKGYGWLDGPCKKDGLGVAAVLRAVTENCVPDDSEGHWVYIPYILAIATEIETNCCGLGIELESANE